jgi:hypothetical protein
VTSFPDGPAPGPPTIITAVTSDTAHSGGGSQSGAPRATPEATDIDPTASPKRLVGGLLRVPSPSNGWGEPAGGTEVSSSHVLTGLILREYMGSPRSCEVTVLERVRKVKFRKASRCSSQTQCYNYGG